MFKNFYAPSTPPFQISSTAGPVSFKAKRWRKTLDFIRYQTSRPEPDRGCSEVDPELFDIGCCGDRLLAGVARLVFRHIAETQREGREGSSWSRSRESPSASSKPTTCDFNRDLFFVSAERRTCLRRCCKGLQFGSPSDEKTVDTIFELLDRVFALLDCPMELAVLSAIYIETLTASRAIRLTFNNWLSIVVAALLTASKVWEDISPWNSDFSRILTEAVGLRLKTPTSLYILESRFMKALDWQVGVSGETYASYYFALRDADLPMTPRTSFNSLSNIPFRSLSWSQTGTVVMTMVGLSSSAVASQPSLTASGVQMSEDSVDDLPMPNDTHLQRIQLRDERQKPFLEDVTHVPEGKEQAFIQERWLLDKHNPYVGSFRHAQEAGPPSRHINDRSSMSRMKTSSSAGTKLNQLGTWATGSMVSRASSPPRMKRSLLQ